MKILHRDDLPLGGFSGLKEHRLVMNPELFGPHVNPGTWPGIAGFAYLADARFDPKGETRLHEHKEIDVISVMLEGRIDHQGSLETGQGLEAGHVQIQRAGGEGFSHNEINPDDTRNRMLQLWVLPEQAGERASYRLYKPVSGKMTRVYGGSHDQADTLASHTVIEVGHLNPTQTYILEKPFLAYLATGKATANNADIQEGDLFQAEQLSFTAKTAVQLVVIYEI
ncbi:MAG: pilus assembly protein [Methyloprofundus sp.]|nr:pilus assembly protein [Methyloprofundus sp.]